VPGSCEGINQSGTPSRPMRFPRHLAGSSPAPARRWTQGMPQWIPSRWLHEAPFCCSAALLLCCFGGFGITCGHVEVVRHSCFFICFFFLGGQARSPSVVPRTFDTMPPSVVSSETPPPPCAAPNVRFVRFASCLGTQTSDCPCCRYQWKNGAAHNQSRVGLGQSRALVFWPMICLIYVPRGLGFSRDYS
jgi:hypothetical protein